MINGIYLLINKNLEEYKDDLMNVVVLLLVMFFLVGLGIIVIVMGLLSGGLFGKFIIIFVFVILCVIMYVILISVNEIIKFFGKNVMIIIIKMMGFILMIIGIEMLIIGIKIGFYLI